MGRQVMGSVPARPIAEALDPALREALERCPAGTSDAAVIDWARRRAEARGAHALVSLIDSDPEGATEVLWRILEELEAAEDVYPVALVESGTRPDISVVWETWPELSRRLTTLQRVRTDKLGSPGWLPIDIKEGCPAYREEVNVSEVWALVCDIDDGSLLHEVQGTLRSLGLRYAMHTTWSHSAQQHKARVILPLSEPCPARKWRKVWASGSRWALAHGMEIDPRCKDPSRYYTLPCLPATADVRRVSMFVAEAEDGPCLSWRDLLREYPPPPEREAPRVHLASLGRDSHDLDAQDRRRKIFARRLVEHRCRQIVAHGKGGRNSRCFAAARCVGSIALSGVIDVQWAADEIVAAGEAAGLPRKEAIRAVEQGLHYGQQDGEWQWE